MDTLKGLVGGAVTLALAVVLVLVSLREVSILCHASACHAHANLCVLTANAMKGRADADGLARTRGTLDTLSGDPARWLLNDETKAVVASDRAFLQGGGDKLASGLGDPFGLAGAAAAVEAEQYRALRRQYLDSSWVVKWFVRD